MLREHKPSPHPPNSSHNFLPHAYFPYHLLPVTWCQPDLSPLVLHCGFILPPPPIHVQIPFTHRYACSPGP